MSGTVLCLDVGGTYIRVGRYNPSTADLVFIRRTPTLPAARDAETPRAARFIARLREVIQSDLVSSDVAVSAALAGPVSADGRVWALPTIARSECVLLDTKSLQEQLATPSLYLLNDMTAASYGLLSSTRQTFCVVTIGTGLGIRLVIDGQPIVGSLGLAGEIGHVRVDFSEHPHACDCGGFGHLGAVASGRGMANVYSGSHRGGEEVARGTTGIEVDDLACARAYKRGDTAAREEVLRQGALLGRTLAPILTACGISDVVLMGGAVQAMDPDYANAVQAALDDCVWDVIRRLQPPTISVEFDGSLPLLGAGRLAALRADDGPD